jgi:hypothetical protein
MMRIGLDPNHLTPKLWFVKLTLLLNKVGFFLYSSVNPTSIFKI